MGRTKIKDNLTLRSMSYIRTERFLLWYASSISASTLFKKWKIRFSITPTKVVLNYIIWNQIEFSSEIKFCVKNRNDMDDIMYRTQDFVLNVFMNYEWQGKAMKLKEIGVLLWIKPQSVETIINWIIEKIQGFWILTQC